MRSPQVLAGLIAVALAGCGGSSGGPEKSDGGGDRGAALSGGAGSGPGGAGGAAGGAGGHSSGGGSGGAGGLAGGGGSVGVAGGGIGGGEAGAGGGNGVHDGGAGAGGCPSQNPDPCICGRPDANALSASQCAQEKACRAAGGVWEAYVVFPAEGGSYGPRCQSPDGAAFDAS